MICSDISNNNLYNEFIHSAKSEYKVNYLQNNIFSEEQSQNEIIIIFGIIFIISLII